MYGQKHNPDISPEAVFLDLLEIPPDLLRKDVYNISPVDVGLPDEKSILVLELDGCHGRHPRREQQRRQVFRTVLVYVLRDLGAGSDEGHRSPENVDQLADLVKPELPNEPADPRDPRVASDGDQRSLLIGVANHRAELEDPKVLSVLRDPFLAVENPASAVNDDRERDNQEKRKKKHQHDPRNEDVKHPFPKETKVLFS